MRKSKFTKEILEPIVKESKSFSEVVRKLMNSDKVHGGMIGHIKKAIIKNQIDFSHFNKRFNCVKFLIGEGPNKMTIEKLINNYLSSIPKKRTCNSNLKRWIFSFNLMENKCDVCYSPDEWMGKKLVLQLDHIDGNNLNNELSNLRIICPNCHSQTENYAGKRNKRHGE